MGYWLALSCLSPPFPNPPSYLFHLFAFHLSHHQHILFALADSRQQVSLLAQRLSGGPGSDLQNHVAAGSGQVSGEVLHAMGPPSVPGMEQ